MTTKSIDTSLQSLNDYDSDAFNQYTTTKSLKCQKETDIYNKSKKLDVYAYKFFIWFIKRIFLVGFIYIVLDFEDLFLKRKEVRNIDTYWDSFKAFLCIFCAIYFVNLINKEKKSKKLKKNLISGFLIKKRELNKSHEEKTVCENDCVVEDQPKIIFSENNSNILKKNEQNEKKLEVKMTKEIENSVQIASQKENVMEKRELNYSLVKEIQTNLRIRRKKREE